MQMAGGFGRWHAGMLLLSPVLGEAFRNTFVNLIAFLFLLNPTNKTDKKSAPKLDVFQF